MRPEALYPLFAPLTALRGVGPRIAALLEKLAGPLVVDLLWHLPSGLVDRRHMPKVAAATPGSIATMALRVDTHVPGRNPRQPYKVICSDDTGFMELVFFHARPDYLMKTLPPGETRIVSGRVEYFNEIVQMTHPDHVVAPDDVGSLARVEPVYPMTTGLTPKPLNNAIRAALEGTPDLPEWCDAAWVAERGWQDWRTALLSAHAPEDASDLEPSAPNRQRLAYDELLANQLALMLVRARQRRRSGRAISGDGHLRRRAIDALRFSLTASQQRANEEIAEDMAAETRMLRLLQGDVGSGKTVVALIAMLNAVETGAQAALMAPTEILARQHMATIAPIAEAAGVQVAVLTGREKRDGWGNIAEGLRRGDIDIAIGTHALFQEDVEFKDLALVVIDEQHRFGVHQRLSLAQKGAASDMLVMTATPIPRTLMMTAYGDLDGSRLTEKPAGRRPVETRALPLSRLAEVVQRLKTAIADGARVYWVCPLVEDSETTDLAATTERKSALSQVFGDRVGLVHGRMKGKEKDAAMARFATGEIDILVATTVIEVGVDVPEASVMVVEHAERFGLAQLHQLRGRVGRGGRRSSCVLLYAQPLGETARARLNVMRETDDGFRIAEEDLRLRGAGEVLGTRQSGLPSFRLADLAVHADLLAAASDDARLIMARDPGLKSPRGEALRTLLYLFRRDEAVKTLQSG